MRCMLDRRVSFSEYARLVRIVQKLNQILSNIQNAEFVMFYVFSTDDGDR